MLIQRVQLLQDGRNGNASGGPAGADAVIGGLHDPPLLPLAVVPKQALNGKDKLIVAIDRHREPALSGEFPQSAVAETGQLGQLLDGALTPVGHALV